jgi:uncharacterized membrane protein YozB (DUF420 family)
MNPHRSDRYFFGALGAWFLLVTLVGFSPTFFFRSAGNPLPGYMRLHGILATVWVLLFAVQTGLLSARQRKLHATLGMLSLPVCLAVAATATLTTFHAVAWRKDAILGTALNGATVAALLVLVALGVLQRRRPDAHKRYMATAFMIFVSPAASRWGHNGLIPESAVVGLVLLPWIALLTYDYRSRGALHRVSLIAMPGVLAGHMLASLAAASAAFESLVRRIAAAG